MPIRGLVFLATAALLGLQVLATPTSAGQRVALVISNASYAHAPSLAVDRSVDWTPITPDRRSVFHA